jgi:DNA replication protein
MAKTLPGFIGFPEKQRPVIVPDSFFTDLLPQIDDLAELKLTVYAFWLLNEQSGELRYLRGDDLRADARLLISLNLESDLRTPLAALEDALQRAVARNTFLRMDVETGDEADPDREDWYFLNTVKGRRMVALIRQGKLGELQKVIPEEARLHVERPNVFVLYEQNIGLMTELIAEQLRDMERTYPPEWIHEAFEIAVIANKRALRYIQAVLRRWETEGKNETNGRPGRDSASEQSKNYAPDEYSDLIIR